MIYSTCTYNEAENEANLVWINNQHNSEFLSLNIDQHWGIDEIHDGSITGYRFYPHRVKGEGFFLAAFRKKEHEEMIRLTSKRKRFSSPDKKMQTLISHWLKNEADTILIQRDERIQYLPLRHADTIAFLADNLSIVTAGTLAAAVKHDKIIPEHALALSIHLNKDVFDCMALTTDEAIAYMKKETLPLPAEARKGFALITHDDLPLGWVNVLGNRINNLYPTAWRIRM